MKWTATAMAVAAFAAIASGNTSLPQQATNTLTAIDTVPTRQQLDNAFDDSPSVALANLATLAKGDDPTSDIGIRLRAIHALAKYCATSPCTTSDIAHQSIVRVISDNTSQTSGSPLLLLRAAVETLGMMRVSIDWSTLSPLLNHPSRDVRAATARALQDLCNSNAVAPLRIRYSQEGTEQVKLAISEALRILQQCSASP